MKAIFAAGGKKSTFLSAVEHRRFAKGKNEKVAGDRLRAGLQGAPRPLTGGRFLEKRRKTIWASANKAKAIKYN